MRKLVVIVAALLVAACSKPTDIVFGPEPLKQMAEQGEQFKKLPEEDRALLAAYIGLNQMAKVLSGKDANQISGRTVGEVLTDARTWKVKMQEQEAAQKKKDEEAAALKAKVLAERKVITDKLGESVTVAVLGKKLYRQDFSRSRLYDELEISYAVENKTDRPMLQVKGVLYVADATGDQLGTLRVNFAEPIKARSILKTDTGRVWVVKRFQTGALERIADAPLEGMKTRFEVEAIAYKDGEVVKAPDLP